MAENISCDDFDVELEFKSGSNAYKKIVNGDYKVVVVSLSRLPSHGLETAKALRSNKKVRNIPLIFVDGKGEALGKAKSVVPDAVYVKFSEIKDVLEIYRFKSNTDLIWLIYIKIDKSDFDLDLKL